MPELSRQLLDDIRHNVDKANFHCDLDTLNSICLGFVVIGEKVISASSVITSTERNDLSINQEDLIKERKEELYLKLLEKVKRELNA